jgi:hypothetical protein
MSDVTFGKLEKVDPKALWETLADKFTPWLGEEENLTQLGEAIGMDIQREEGDPQAGSFNSEIVCKDKTGKGWVLIDTLTDADDHGAFGRVVVSAAATEGATFVLISAGFSDQARTTLDWLNRNSGGGYGFFGVEIELWQIGDSNFAPRFNAVSKPSEGGGAAVAPAAPAAEPDGAETEIQSEAAGEAEGEAMPENAEYWAAFGAVVAAAEVPFEAPEATPQAQVSFPLEQPGFVFVTLIDTAEKRLGIYLQLSGEAAGANLRALHKQKAAIETEIASPLEWREVPDKQEGFIMLRREEVDPSDRDAWTEQHEWLRDQLSAFHQAFAGRVEDIAESAS